METNLVVRLYGGSIALVSGVYAIASSAAAMSGAAMGASFGMGGWVMLVTGITVLVHGLMLLTPAVRLLGRFSGPLMIVWGVAMLANQVLTASIEGWGMAGTAGGMGGPMGVGMGWNGGMVAIAVLMLISGSIMTRYGSEESMSMR